MRGAFAETDALEQFLTERTRRAIAAQLHRHNHVLEGGERRDELEVLEHKADVLVPHARPLILVHVGKRLAIEQHGAGSRPIQPGAKAQQSRLAAAGRPQDGTGGALRQFERNALQHRQNARRLSYSFS
jgi:hypothetical protein